MLLGIEKLIFVFISILSIYFTSVAVRKIAANISSARGEINWKQVLANLPGTLFNYLSLNRTFKTRWAVSITHALVAWGFLTFLVINLNDVLYGFFDFRLLESLGLFGNVYRSIADIFNVLILLGIMALAIRRFVFSPDTFFVNKNVIIHPKAISGIARDSAIVAGFIFLHNSARLFGEAAYVARVNNANDPWQPIISYVAKDLYQFSGSTLVSIEHSMFWLSLGAVVLFLPYFALSKHIHIFFVPINQALKPYRKAIADIPYIDLNDESIESFGATNISDLGYEQVIDAYACIMCFRCQDACPAYQTGKPLSPAALEINKRYAFNSGSKTDIALTTLISEEAVWACTTCGACVDVCPVGNEPMKDILEIRRSLAMMESSFPKQLETAFKGMERNANPWNQPIANRTKWAEGINVPTIETNPTPDILWWVGCSPSTDPRAQKTARAFADILNTAGINFATLGKNESCTGDSARRAGREDIFFALATQNVEVLNEVNPTLIVTSCPHCLNTIKNEYPAFGGNYKVIHHSELINNLIGSGKIELEQDSTSPSVTYHDPCYLGRHNQQFEQPRNIMKSLSEDLREMPSNRDRSFCCGAGGAQVWKEESGDSKINITRYEQAKSTSSQTIAVACPFCLTMLTDAAKEDDHPMDVLDIAELVAQKMIRK